MVKIEVGGVFFYSANKFNVFFLFKLQYIFYNFWFLICVWLRVEGGEFLSVSSVTWSLHWSHDHTKIISYHNYRPTNVKLKNNLNQIILHMSKYTCEYTYVKYTCAEMN